MAQFWTALGQNGRKVAQFNKHRDLLAQVSFSRGNARDRVLQTIDQLNRLSDDLFELRDQVKRPVPLSGDTPVPLEAHLHTLREAVKKFHTFRQQGVERCVVYRQVGILIIRC